MKRLAIILALACVPVLAGCHKAQPQAAVKALPVPAPCAPNVTQELRGVVRPTVQRKPTEEETRYDCPFDMRTVLPSDREIQQAVDDGTLSSSDHWLNEHEYCIPDGERLH